MSLQVSELTVDNIGSWPLLYRVGAIALMFVIMMGAGYWFHYKSQLQSLRAAESKHHELRQVFEAKQQSLMNLDEYKQQLVSIRKTFSKLLHQLPGKTEIPGLLEAISEKGIRNGLSFRLIKPLPEDKREFYAALPIKIDVVGNYHQLAEFISAIANLPRIVTINEFTIVHPNKKSKASSATGPQELVMRITAKTYRYLGDVK